jgi:hypothetical protein
LAVVHDPIFREPVPDGKRHTEKQKELAYQVEAPTLWDVDFRTTVAQAELEDREQPGAYPVDREPEVLPEMLERLLGFDRQLVYPAR